MYDDSAVDLFKIAQFIWLGGLGELVNNQTHTYCILYTYCDGSKVSFALSSFILFLKVEGGGPNTNNVPQRHLHLAQKIIVLQGRRDVVNVVHDEPEYLELLEPVLHLDGFAELWVQTVLYSLRAGVLVCVCGGGYVITYYYCW